MNPELAQQRQQEVRAVLRNPLRDGLEVMACWRTTRVLSEHFFPSLHRASRQVDLPLDTLFQYILYELYHPCKSDGLQNEEGSKQCHDLFFDGQHAQGNIPMHQAKVLDRSARLPMVDLQERLSKVCSKEQLLQMIHHVSSLRSLLRMKVEDANDLSMAHKTVLLIHEYLSYLIALSRAYRGREEDPYVADCGTTCVADKPVDDELWTLYSEGVPANAKSMHGSGFQGALQFDLSSTLPQGLAELPPRPEREDLDQARDLEGIVCYVHAALPMLLSDVTGSIPVSLRIQILDDLQAWIPLLFSNTSVSTHPSLFDSLPLTLVTQLGDKRSQVVKSTCQVIQVSLDQGTRCHPSWDESRRTLLRKVLPGLLNGVPVTVNAIATPCHSAMRICLLSAAQLGCITAQVMDLLHDALAHRGQVVLKRRALEYATLLLLHVHHPSWDAVETAQRLHLTSVKERDEGGERQHKNPTERVLEWLMTLCTAVTHASAEVRKAARREWVVWWELLRNAAFIGPPSKNDSDLLYEQVQDSVPLEKRCAHETSCDANHVIEALHKFMDIIAKSQIHAQEKTGSGCATQDNVFSESSFATIHSTIRSLPWATLVSEYQSELGTEPALWASNLESIIWAPSGSPISTNTCVAKGGTPTHLQNNLGISKTSSRVSLRDRIALREKMQAKEE